MANGEKVGEKLERSVEIQPAFDKRSSDPKKNYGIHGAEIKFLLSGKKGVIQFNIFTEWHLPHVARENKLKGYWPEACGTDIGHHAHKPQYEGEQLMGDGPCSYLNNGKQCYYDGSSLAAQGIFKIMLEKGGEAMWAEMQKRYDALI